MSRSDRSQAAPLVHPVRTVPVLLRALVGLALAAAVALTGAPPATAAPAPERDGQAVAAPQERVSTPLEVGAARAAEMRAGRAPRSGWAWPLDPEPAVLTAFDPPAQRWQSGHRGVDLAASVGQPVRAPTTAVVVLAGSVVDRGVLVLLTGTGLRLTFEPVTATVAVGARVDVGQVVGTVSDTPGHCRPATCLHWGALRERTYLDPLALLGLRRVILLPL